MSPKSRKYFNKMVKWFKSQFPEFELMSDEECFAFACYIKCNRKVII